MADESFKCISGNCLCDLCQCQSGRRGYKDYVDDDEHGAVGWVSNDGIVDIELTPGIAYAPLPMPMPSCQHRDQ